MIFLVEQKCIFCQQIFLRHFGIFEKLILQRLALRDAGKQCKEIGGRIFMPESVEEYNEIGSLRNDLNLNVNKNFFWVFFKIANPAKLSFILYIHITHSL